MTLFTCGDRLRFGQFAPGTSGCLVRFPDIPDRVLLLAAGHVVLPPFAQQGDAITADGSEDIIGRLFTWTTIDGNPTTDAALIWVDPARVSPELRGLGSPTSVNFHPAVGDVVRIVPHGGQQAPREARIKSLAQDIDVMVIGPGWDSSPTITYRGQIVTDRQISEGGDSGAVALDAQGRVVGMVVAGSPETGTVITPMSAILANAAWSGMELELVRDIDDDALAPPMPGVPLPLAEPAIDLNLEWLKTEQALVARQVIDRLSHGGFGPVQIAAALGNAMAESALNPKARNTTTKEDSVGLFQFNRKGGEGAGFSVEELEDIDLQCTVVAKKVGKWPEFMDTDSLEQAVEVFVKRFEKPANPEKAIAKRVPLAQRFLAA